MSFFPTSFSAIDFRPQVPAVPIQMKPQGDVHLAMSLPRQQYKSVKIAPVPFDPRVSDSGRFENIEQAMEFIAMHCLIHHSQFTKQLAKMYLPFCRVLSFAHGGYIAVGKMIRRDFDTAFAQAQRKISD